MSVTQVTQPMAVSRLLTATYHGGRTLVSVSLAEQDWYEVDMVGE